MIQRGHGSPQPQSSPHQWRIQDFQEVALTYYLTDFCQNLYEMKKIGLRGGARPLNPLYQPQPTSNMAAIDTQHFLYRRPWCYPTQFSTSPNCSYLFTVSVVCDTWKKIKVCFLGSYVSLVVPIPAPPPPVPGTFCVPIPDPPDACRITLQLMALHRKLLSTELCRGWHPIRAQERIKGTMLFFLYEFDSGFSL